MNKDISRHLAELHNLIHREIINYATCTDNCNENATHISLSSSCILSYLHSHNDCDVYQRDLEREFGVRRSTMSKVLSSLEQKGYIKRVSVDTDRRLKKITLTEKAFCIADKIKSNSEDLEKKMIQSISEDELKIFKQTLEKIKQNLMKEATN